MGISEIGRLVLDRKSGQVFRVADAAVNSEPKLLFDGLSPFGDPRKRDRQVNHHNLKDCEPATGYLCRWVLGLKPDQLPDAPFELQPAVWVHNPAAWLRIAQREATVIAAATANGDRHYRERATTAELFELWKKINGSDYAGVEAAATRRASVPVLRHGSRR